MKSVITKITKQKTFDSPAKDQETFGLEFYLKTDAINSALIKKDGFFDPHSDLIYFSQGVQITKKDLTTNNIFDQNKNIEDNFLLFQKSFTLNYELRFFNGDLSGRDNFLCIESDCRFSKSPLFLQYDLFKDIFHLLQAMHTFDCLIKKDFKGILELSCLGNHEDKELTARDKGFLEKLSKILSQLRFSVGQDRIIYINKDKKSLTLQTHAFDLSFNPQNPKRSLSDDFDELSLHKKNINKRETNSYYQENILERENDLSMLQVSIQKGRGLSHKNVHASLEREKLF